MPDLRRSIRINLSDFEMPPEGVETRYANSVLVNHTAWDFSLFFTMLDIIPTSEGKETRVSNRLVTKVTISPHLVKGLIRALQQNVTGYEQEYRIKLPEQVGGTGEDS